MDLVRAVHSEHEQGLEAVALVERSGHSNYMVLCKSSHAEFLEYWKRLEKLGCTFESGALNLGSGDEILWAIDVPPSSDIFRVYDILTEGEAHGVWVFQEGAVGHDVKRERGTSGDT